MENFLKSKEKNTLLKISFGLHFLEPSSSMPPTRGEGHFSPKYECIEEVDLAKLCISVSCGYLSLTVKRRPIIGLNPACLTIKCQANCSVTCKVDGQWLLKLLTLVGLFLWSNFYIQLPSRFLLDLVHLAFPILKRKADLTHTE